MRFACVRIEHLPTRLEAALRPELSNQPLVVLRAWDEHVLDASPDVEASGIRPGDSRRRVEQLCPHAHAVVLPARETLYQSHHETLKSVLANCADRVETGTLGEFYIEVGARCWRGLLALNHQRYEEEVEAGLHDKETRAGGHAQADKVKGGKKPASKKAKGKKAGKEQLGLL